MSDKIKVTRSSGNVFADLGLPNAPCDFGIGYVYARFRLSHVLSPNGFRFAISGLGARARN